MKDNILKLCIELLIEENVKNECKIAIKPFFEYVLNEVYPFIYLFIGLICLIFLLLLVILVLLLIILRNKNNILY